MTKFHKIVAVGPIAFKDDFASKCQTVGEQFLHYPQMPGDDDELIALVGDADALLVPLSVFVTGRVLRACPKLRYVGMCCSLYTPESANVDLLTAKELGIPVYGISDYGDDGVPEYIISELVGLLHGYRGSYFRGRPREIPGLKAGILGMGVVGRRVSAALQFFGADVRYFSRTRKEDVEKKGISYQPLDTLLHECDVIVGCLHRGTILLHERELARFGQDKILMNVAISTFTDLAALRGWLSYPGNFYLCDNEWGYDADPEIAALPNVLVPHSLGGISEEVQNRLNRKVLENLARALQELAANGGRKLSGGC